MILVFWYHLDQITRKSQYLYIQVGDFNLDVTCKTKFEQNVGKITTSNVNSCLFLYNTIKRVGSSNTNIITNLNHELLCFDIMHKEGEALLPLWVFRCVRNL